MLQSPRNRRAIRFPVDAGRFPLPHPSHSEASRVPSRRRRTHFQESGGIAKNAACTTQVTNRREIMGQGMPARGHIASRIFPEIRPRNGTAVGQVGAKWDSERPVWDGTRTLADTAVAPCQRPRPLITVPNRGLCVPFPLGAVPSLSRNSIELPWFSLKWDKWEGKLRRG